MKILLVEDDDRIARPIIEELTHQSHVVDHVADGRLALAYTEVTNYDLLLVDWMLPGLDGVSLCRRLRARGHQGHILIITARDQTPDKVLGLDAGADDYLAKPFDLEELSARVRALARRPPALQDDMISHGPLRLDRLRQQVNVDGRPVLLTTKEFMILECFLLQPERVFARSQLLDRLWDIDTTSSDATIRTHIANIRAKLDAAGLKRDPIVTVYGAGYRLSATG
ncbi:MAG: response regulator transcription factor [Synechococcaceae cyanobacterium ELA182]